MGYFDKYNKQREQGKYQAPAQNATWRDAEQAIQQENPELYDAVQNQRVVNMWNNYVDTQQRRYEEALKEATNGRGNRSYLREGMAEGSYQAGMAAANDQRTQAQKRIDSLLGVDSSKVTGKKTDWGEIVRGAAYKGADQFSTSMVGGLNWLFGGAAEEIHNLGVETINGIIGGVNSLTGANIKQVENNGNLLTNWYETLKETKAHNEEVFAANANSSRAAQIVDEFGTSFVAAVPMALEALMTAPYAAAKAGATATTAGLQYLSGLQAAKGLDAVGMMAQQSMSKMMQNPQFWTSYVQAIGDSSESAAESGMSPSDAAIYTMINGFFNAVIEVGGGDETLGGIQTFPMRLQQLEEQGGKKAVVEWFKDSVLGEGLEEVAQGVFERGVKAPATGAAIASLDPNDTEAIFNPWTSAQEFTGGAVVGGLLGGGQVAAQNSLQTIRGNKSFKGDSQVLLDSAKKSGGETYAKAIEQIEQNAQRDKNGAVQLNQDQAAQLYDIIRNQGETGEYIGAVQDKRNGELLTTVFSNDGIDLTEDEHASLTGIVNEGNAGITDKILGMRDAYKAGESGQKLPDVMLEMEGRGLTFNQISRAWAAGANVQTDMTGPVNVETEEGRATLEANLAPLGTHIDAAVKAYDGKQDAARYSAAMQKAAFLYAANGADLAKIVQDARDGKVADIVGYLTDEQVKLAQEIGNEQREQTLKDEQKAIDTTKEVQEQAAAIMKGQTVTAQALAEMDTAIDVANRASQRAVDTINQTVANLEAMVKANPKAAQTEAYKAAYDAAMQQKKNIQGLQKTVTELRRRKAELEGRKTIQRKKGTVSYSGGTVDGVKYDGVDPAKLTRQQKKITAMVEHLADAVNLDYVFISADPGMGGAYDRGGVVYININAGMGVGNFNQTMAAASLSHELTHWMQEYAKEQYRELKDFIVSEILKADPQELNRLVQQQQRWEKGRSLSYEQALDEVVANACQTMLLDSKAITKLARQNMNLAERIRDFIEDWSNKIKDAFAEVDTSQGAIYDSLRAVEGSLDQIQELWDKGIEAAAQSYNTEYTVNQTKAIAEAAAENNAPAIAESETQNQIWTGEEPKKVQYGFKLMNTDENGLPHAMFIDAAKPYELGQWYAADSPKMENLIKLEPGYAYLVDENDVADEKSRIPVRKEKGSFRGLPGKAAVNKATEENKRWMVIDQYADGSKSVHNVGINGSGGVSTFALRPGIHAVDIPSMAHIGSKSKGSSSIDTRRPNQQWYLIEYPVDQDYNQEAYSHITKDIREHLPEKGWYSYQTNSGAEARQHWFITGGMRIVGAISEADARRYAREHGFEEDLPWKMGKSYSEDNTIDLDEYIRTTTAQPTPSKEEMRQRIEAERNAAQNGGVQFQRFDDAETVSIKQQIQANAGILNSMNPATTLQINDLPNGIQKQRQWAVNRLKSSGFKVDNREIGVIEFNERQINTGLNYLNESGEIAAFAALPAVLKRGKIIDAHDHHKNRARDSITIAAPVVINGVRGNMAVALTKTSKTHYHTHRILMPDGSTFVFENANAEVTPAEDQPERTNVSRPSLRRSDSSIADTTPERKAKMQTIDADGAGIAVDQEDGSAYVQYSRWTWEQSDYVQDRDDAAKELSKALGISQKKAKDYIDSVNSVAKMIADSKGRLDYDDTGLSSFVGNTEYGGSFDFTTLCKKRRLLTGTFSAIQNALANTALTANEILEIRKMMDDAGLEVSCGKCYVEGSRASMGLFTKEFLKLYEKYHPGAWAPNMAQMNTPDGIEWVRQTHPEVYEQYEYFWNHYGTLRPGDPNLFASQQKPKLYQMRSAYKGEVMRHFRNDGSIAEKNKNGGMRMQSFSDFEIVHLIDAMQVIMDMSRVGLNGQAYTKVPDFAWALGKTGLKINLSIDAWDVQDGKLIFNNKEGMNFDEAMRIRNANSENVGTICCVYDDAQLLAAMADDRIDFIIPFHRSQWKKSQYKGMGLPATTKDYTYQQNEKWLNPKEHMHEYRGRQVPTRCSNYMPNEYWDFSKSGKENAEKYLQMCAEAGKRPKFYRLLTNNGDGSFSLKADGSTDGYWKLLIDFKMYDNDGKGAPQRPVRPDFNMEEIQRMLTSYEGGHQQFPVAQGVVDEFVEKYKARHPGQTQFQRWDGELSEPEQKAVERFGTTTDYAEAGYILPNGQMLRFTDDDHKGERRYDHRTIGMVYGVNVDLSVHKGFNAESADYLEQFINDGNIRIDAGDPDLNMDAGLQLSGTKPLTAEQEQTVRDFIEWKQQRDAAFVPDEYSLSDGPVGLRVEFGGNAGYWIPRVANQDTTLSYEGGQIRASRVIQDIRNFYKTGKVPQRSVVAQFHGSQFQRWDDTDGDTAAERNGREQSYARLQSENKILSDTIKGLNKLIAKKDTTIGQLQDRLKLNKTPEVREADAKKLARQLLREHNSIADFERVAADIKALGDYLAQAKEVSEDEVKSRARNIAAEILENATEQYRMEDEQLDTIRGAIKGRKLTISPDFLGELDQAGGYDLFRRQNFGKFTLARADSKSINRDDYMSVSQFYADMQNQYGKTYFPDATNEGEEAIILASVMQAADPMEVNPYRQYMGEATEELANRITRDALNGILRLEPDRYADAEYLKEKSRNEALNARVKQLVEENALSKEEAGKLWQQVHDLNTQLEHADLQYRALMNAAEDRIAQVRAEGIVREVETRAKERERAAKNIQALKDHYKELQQNARERREESAGATKYRKQVFEKAGKLREMLLKNDDKLHVPEVLKAPLAAFLESLDFTSKRALRGGAETNADRAFAANLQKIQQILSNQQDYINGGDMKENLGGYIDVSPDSMDFLRRVSEMITTALSDNREYTINQMSAAELKDLSNFLSNLRTAINGMNKFMANARFESVREAASQDIESMEELGKASEAENSALFSAIAWENGTPFYVFRRFGEGGKAIFDSLTRGWEKMAFNVKKIMDFTEKTYSDKEVREWQQERHEIELEDGRKVTMTTGQIMSLSMLLNREQARKHMDKGGVRIGDIKGKKGTIADITHYHLTGTDISNIIGKLTDRQADVARKLQHFMAEQGSEWGNEISMRRFGYRFYAEGDAYFPIKTDSTDRPMSDTDAQQNSMFRLLNLSASKSLNPKATNALVVEDIFDVFADHMSDMAKLNGMGLPILDAIKWFNFKERIDLGDGQYDTRTMQATMQQAFGDKSLSYFRTLMKDINGVTESGDRGADPFSKLVSNYKAAAVAANLRVAFLQPTSYVRASYLIKPQYLLQAFTNKNAYKEAMEYSGTAVWKSLGYYDTNIARGMRDQIKHNESWKDKVVEKSMGLAELGDRLTWGRLWVACKMQTAAETGLQGEELKQKTADLFREVIYSSQVMDSTLTRSELMRGKSMHTKALTAFMAEPTLSYNMVMDAGMEYRMNMRKYGKGEAWQRSKGYIAKAFTVYACSAAFSAVVESIADAFRDDDDEEDFFIKWSQAMFGEGNLLKGNLVQDLDLLGKQPYLRTAMSLLQGYKNRDMSVAALEVFIDAFNIWMETLRLNLDSMPEPVQKIAGFMRIKALDKPTKTTYYGNMTTWGKLYKTMQALSQATGLAAANLSRDVFAVWNTTVGAFKPEWKMKTYESTKDRKRMEAVKELTGQGVPKELAQQALQEPDADGNGSLKQDELGPWLNEKIQSGELTDEQADAIWNTQGWKTSFSDYSAKAQKKAQPETQPDAQPETPTETPAPKLTISTPAPKPTQQASLSGFESFKKSVSLYSDKKASAYQGWENEVKPLGVSLDSYVGVINAADAAGDGNGSVKQDEMGAQLVRKINSGELTYEQAEAIWHTIWNGARSKTFYSWYNG